MRTSTALILCLTIVGCNPGAPSTAEWMSRDSAGIEIVENSADATTRHLGAILDESRGQPVGDLELTKVTAARLLTDGRIVLTDNAANRLILIEPTSGARKAIGRAGGGPEEFRGGFRGMWRCAGDTLMVRGGPAGLKVFDSAGAFVRMNAAAHMRGPAYGVSTDCTSIVISRWHIESDEIFMRDTMTLGWYDVPRDSLIDVLTIESRVKQVVPYLGERMPLAVPFAEDWSFAVNGDRLYAGLSGTPEVRVHDRRGRMVRIIRWAAEPAPITGSDRERFETTRRQLDERIGPGASARVPSLSDFTLPATKPLYSELLVDDEGYLWVRKYPEDEETFERAYGPGFVAYDPEWWLFAPSGQLLGSVTTPRRFVIKDIRNGMVVGLRLDDDDVPHIYLVPMRRPALTTP